MRRPWQLIVVRAWYLEERRIIRMTMSSDSDQAPCTSYVTSSRLAGDQLSRWLDEVDSGAEPALADGVLTEPTDDDG